MTNDNLEYIIKKLSVREFDLIREEFTKPKIISWKLDEKCIYFKGKVQYLLLGTFNENSSDLNEEKIIFLERVENRYGVGEGPELITDTSYHSAIKQLASGQFQSFREDNKYLFDDFDQHPVYFDFLGLSQTANVIRFIERDLLDYQRKYPGTYPTFDPSLEEEIKQIIKNHSLPNFSANEIKNKFKLIYQKISQEEKEVEKKKLKRREVLDKIFGANKKKKYFSTNLRQRLLFGGNLATTSKTSHGIGVQFGRPDFYEKRITIVDFILPEKLTLAEAKNLGINYLAHDIKILKRRECIYDNITRKGHEIDIYLTDYESLLMDSYPLRFSSYELVESIKRFKIFLNKIDENEFHKYNSQVKKEVAMATNLYYRENWEK